MSKIGLKPNIGSVWMYGGTDGGVVKRGNKYCSTTRRGPIRYCDRWKEMGLLSSMIPVRTVVGRIIYLIQDKIVKHNVDAWSTMRAKSGKV